MTVFRIGPQLPMDVTVFKNQSPSTKHKIWLGFLHVPLNTVAIKCGLEFSLDKNKLA